MWISSIRGTRALCIGSRVSFGGGGGGRQEGHSPTPSPFKTFLSQQMFLIYTSVKTFSLKC